MKARAVFFAVLFSVSSMVMAQSAEQGRGVFVPVETVTTDSTLVANGDQDPVSVTDPAVDVKKKAQG